MRGSLKEKYPKIASELHHVLTELKAGNIHHTSSKQLFWSCAKCGDHWKATINQRVNKIKPCPDCAQKQEVYKMIGVKNKPLFQEWKKLVELRKEIVAHINIFIKRGYAWKKNGILARKKLQQLKNMNIEFRKKILEARDGKKSAYEKDVQKSFGG